MKQKIYYLIILAIGLFSCEDLGCTKKGTNTTQSPIPAQTQTTYANPCPEKDAQIVSLLQQISDLKVENSRLQGIIDCNEKAKKTVSTTSSSVSKAKKSTETKAVAKKPAETTILKRANTQPAASPSYGNPSYANLDFLIIDGKIQYCIMVNHDPALHFPQKALESGVTFTSVEANPTNDGANWVVEPIEFIEGDYGLTVDGVFFVSNEMIERVLKIHNISGPTSVEIKAPWTQWNLKPMKKTDGNWEYDALNGRR